MKTKSMLAAVFFTALLVLPAASFADEVKIDVSGANAIHSTLEGVVGKSVTLKLNSGQEVAGKVAAVGPNAVHIAELKGTEFYDAVVRLDDVSAVIVRMK